HLRLVPDRRDLTRVAAECGAQRLATIGAGPVEPLAHRGPAARAVEAGTRVGGAGGGRRAGGHVGQRGIGHPGRIAHRRRRGADPPGPCGQLAQSTGLPLSCLTARPSYVRTMPTFDVTLRDRTVEVVDGADAYQQEGPMTTFFRRGEGREVIDSWSTRMASFRTADLLAVRRREPVAQPSLRAVAG